MAQAGLAWLASADVASLPAAAQADCLRGLERAESMQTAARAAVLHAFAACSGYEYDGQRSAKAWLRWQARITRGAAGGAVSWMRRLAAHRAVFDALAAGTISASWGRQICDWSDALPDGSRPDADAILLGAAAGGAELADLAALAEEMRRRAAAAADGAGRDDGFDDRWVRLDQTFRGAGSLEGELTPRCAAALAAVLESLGKRSGPEDLRTRRQRDHDALEEACRRLIAAGCLPDRAGQPTQIQLHMSLDQLRGLDGADAAEAAWPGPAAAPGDECDATIVPVVTGTVDADLLDQLAAAILKDSPAEDRAGHALAARAGRGGRAGSGRAARAAREIILRHAADLLSGPAGLAAVLRGGLLDGPAAAVSLPLDVGTATDTIPASLRRAVITRDRHCRFPGCDQPAAACQPHHITHRAHGGPHSLANLLLLCTFHHLIAVHRWGWAITLHPAGTTMAVSPDGSHVLHSHSPPASAA